MATSTRLSAAARNAAADAITALIEASGFLRIYDGTQPTNPDTGWCEWNLELGSFSEEGNQFEVFTGSGYGVTNVAVLGLVGATWKVIALTKIDYGEP